jgi:hypothetical protein
MRLRCCVCGRWMGCDEEIRDISLSSDSYYEDAVCSLAHRSCLEEENDRGYKDEEQYSCCLDSFR